MSRHVEALDAPFGAIDDVLTVGNVIAERVDDRHCFVEPLAERAGERAAAAHAMSASHESGGSQRRIASSVAESVAPRASALAISASISSYTSRSKSVAIIDCFSPQTSVAEGGPILGQLQEPPRRPSSPPCGPCGQGIAISIGSQESRTRERAARRRRASSRPSSKRWQRAAPTPPEHRSSRAQSRLQRHWKLPAPDGRCNHRAPLIARSPDSFDRNDEHVVG